MTKNEFEMLAEITSCGAEPAIARGELLGFETMDAERAEERVATLRALEKGGHVEISDWMEGEKLVSVTARGLRAFGLANGSDPETVEDTIRELGLK